MDGVYIITWINNKNILLFTKSSLPPSAILHHRHHYHSHHRVLLMAMTIQFSLRSNLVRLMKSIKAYRQQQRHNLSRCQSVRVRTSVCKTWHHQQIHNNNVMYAKYAPYKILYSLSSWRLCFNETFLSFPSPNFLLNLYKQQHNKIDRLQPPRMKKKRNTSYLEISTTS